MVFAESVVAGSQQRWHQVLGLAAFKLLRQILHRNPLEPLMAVPRVIALYGTVNAQKTCQAVNSQFAMENVQSMPLELIIRHLFQRNHRRIFCNQSTGFNTRTIAFPAGAPSTIVA